MYWVYITRGGEKTTTFCGGTKNIGTRFFDDVRDVPEVDDGDIKSRPFIDPAAITNCFSGNSQPKSQRRTKLELHGRIVSCQNNTRRRTECSFDDTDDIGNTQTTEERPKKEVLKYGRTGRKVINQRIIFHIDPDEVVETWSWEIEDPRNFLCMEKVGSFIPVLEISFEIRRSDTIHIALR